MKQLKSVPKKGTGIILLFLSLSACFSAKGSDTYKEVKPTLHYTVSMPDPSSHFFHIELFCNGWIKDTIDFKMPRWMPGYYQIMEYAREVRNYSAREVNGKVISVTNTNQNTNETQSTNTSGLGANVLFSQKFFPNTIPNWIAFIAILAIITVLIRKVYLDGKNS